MLPTGPVTSQQSLVVSKVGAALRPILDWLHGVRAAQPIAHGIAVLCLAGALGLLLGRVRVRGVGLGIAGVLFVGIAFGHFGINIDPKVRSFLQEFGLILFVYTIGMQL